MEKGAFKRDSAQPWLPLQYAAQLGCEDICVYLLTLTSAEGDLSRLWEKANHYGIAHFPAGHGQLFFPRALMDCGVDIDLRNARCYTPLCFAVSTCRMPVIRFLLEQFRSRGKEEQDVWRDLIERLPLGLTLDPSPLIFCAIRHNSLGKQIITHEAKLAMVKYLVKDVGVDIWAEAQFSYTDGEDIDHCTGHAVTRRHVLLPLHAAAIEGNQAVLDFFLTEYRMAVNTCTPLSHFTALHFLALSTQSETELLPVVAWLVDKKGADATCRDHKGRTAAKLASRSDKPEMEHYLQRQEARQAVRKVKDKEEARKKAAAAATMAARMKEAEEEMRHCFWSWRPRRKQPRPTRRRRKGRQAEVAKRRRAGDDKNDMVD